MAVLPLSIGNIAGARLVGRSYLKIGSLRTGTCWGNTMARFILSLEIEKGNAGNRTDVLLAAAAGISKSRIKDAMLKGAVWVKRRRGRHGRLRRVSTVLHPGDRLQLFYDEELLRQQPGSAVCLEDFGRYSAWYKPAGLLSQGTSFGDHCSILRQAELFFEHRQRIFPVHRLDRETSGVIILAHGQDAAAVLSRLFREHQVEKFYLAEIAGLLLRPGDRGKIEFPVDGRDALTEFTVISHDPGRGTTCVQARPRTGRLHQIRRHFHQLQHPVVGDPRYGGFADPAGMQLVAAALRFRCPFRGNMQKVNLIEMAEKKQFRLTDRLLQHG